MTRWIALVAALLPLAVLDRTAAFAAADVPEVLEVEVVAVHARLRWWESTATCRCYDVAVKARVRDVVRSASGVKEGATVRLRYEFRREAGSLAATSGSYPLVERGQVWRISLTSWKEGKTRYYEPQGEPEHAFIGVWSRTAGAGIFVAPRRAAPVRPVTGQGGTRAVVKGDGAEVRSGPSNSAQFYVTNRLARGTTVEVVEELPDGWLKIVPPPGSFSWINTNFLEHITPNEPNGVVTLEGVTVPVYIGSEFITDRRPTVIGARLVRGAQITSVGSKTCGDSEGTWMAIEPPVGEYRYLRTESVERQSSSAAGVLNVSTSKRAATQLPLEGQVSYTGMLVRTGRTLRQRTYRLESSQRGVWLPVTYVVAGPDVKLEPYVGQVIELWGTGHYDSELRGNVLQALRVLHARR
jgi:hypothetical protein